jgi:hypothetical protein
MDWAPALLKQRGSVGQPGISKHSGRHPMVNNVSGLEPVPLGGVAVTTSSRNSVGDRSEVIVSVIAGIGFSLWRLTSVIYPYPLSTSVGI